MLPAPHNLPYRDAVGIMLLNADGLVFVAKRIDMISEAWQMPQGGMDDGETPEQTAWREMQEELGTDKGKIIAQSKHWYTYDLPTELVPKIWGGKFRGQRQKWFLMRFLGQDSDINIQTKEPEFSQWKWVEAEQLCSLIVPFKRELYARVIEEFRPLLNNN